MNNHNYDALMQLLGCYFHQDWIDEFESSESALDAIINFESPQQLRAGIVELDKILSSSISDDELLTLLNDQLGCHFEPTSLGLSNKEWLKLVRKKLSDAISTD